MTAAVLREVRPRVQQRTCRTEKQVPLLVRLAHADFPKKRNDFRIAYSAFLTKLAQRGWRRIFSGLERSLDELKTCARMSKRQDLDATVFTTKNNRAYL